MMNKLFLLLFSAITFPSLASEQAIQCPSPLRLTKHNQTGSAWKTIKIAVTKNPSTSTLYDGDFGDIRFSLAPNEHRSKNKLLQTWDLNMIFKAKRNAWLECSYPEKGIALRRVIPNTVKICNSIFKITDKHQYKNVKLISCYS